MEHTKNPVKFLHNKKLIEDFVRYLVSGISSVVVQFGILVGLVEIFKVNATFSSGAGFFWGCVVNYLLLYHWAFCAKEKHHTVVIRYIAVMALTLGLNTFVFWSLNVVMQIWYPFAQTVATCITALMNYLLNRNFTFV